MAATSTALACAAPTGSALMASTVRGDVCRLSSGNAFRTATLVHAAPVSPLSRSNRVVAARATLSQDSKAARREVLVSILSAGAALGFAGAALADPLADIKSKASDAFSGAKNADPTLPSVPSPDGALGGVQDAAESAKSNVQGSIDGIFGKGKPGPFKFGGSKRVASTNAGTGSALGDAKQRIENFGKNPIPENVNKYSDAFEGAAVTATGQGSDDKPRVAEATKKAEALGSSLQKKGGKAISEGKGLVGKAPSTPSLPDILPKTGGFELPKFDAPATPDAGKVAGDVKDSVKSKVDNAKSAAGGLGGLFQ